MTDNHSQFFFGQSTGITIKSTSKSLPYIFFTCIKKRPDGSWEKPSKGEGKTIKCSMEEMVMIYKFLKQKINSWSIYHKFRDENTPISFNWENNRKNKIRINIGSYSKLLGEPQIEILQRLIKHLINEKIEYATISYNPKIENEKTNGSPSPNDFDSNELRSEEEMRKSKIIKENEIINQKVPINGSIKAETEKALLIIFDTGQEVWIPKSIIYSNFKPEIGLNQEFLTENWILKRNNISI